MEPPSERAGTQPLVACLKIATLVVIVIGANHAFEYFRVALDLDIRPSNEDAVHRMIMTAAAFYVLTLAIPFVPGVEIGLGLMVVLGAQIVPLVYLCTIAGLTIAYLIGHTVPPRVLIRLCRDLHLRRAATLLELFDEVPANEKLNFMLSATPNRLTFNLLRYRYLALAALINMPGNFLIGGGGGIAMLTGASRLFRLPYFLLTIAIAVSPVPLIILIFGPSVFGE